VGCVGEKTEGVVPEEDAVGQEAGESDEGSEVGGVWGSEARERAVGDWLVGASGLGGAVRVGDGWACAGGGAGTTLIPGWIVWGRGASRVAG
jgi:hypothetical protein